MNRTNYQLRLQLCVQSHDLEQIKQFLDIVKGSKEVCQVVITEWKEEKTRALSPWEVDDLRNVEGLSVL